MFALKICYTHIRQHSLYGKNQDIRIDSRATDYFGRRISQRFIARTPHAMQGSTFEAQGLSSPKIGEQLEMNQVSVNNWIKRSKAERIEGVKTRPGQGCRPIISTQDEGIIWQA